ncbi:hypothetical protein DNL40_14725 [Xylanimonas oleitrophica]|uniref:Uncharacterized protein n=1 Tax=Xylanimonas oleitrophica TaxID=2607479 RepID=A0A2W5WLI8_9MICO|nr:hypothetical protein [Xylanimonas oleitrophica]PZR51862.1 hypothetical protein DNL40_14725 [Xylanimonas oleitrophica]
MTRTFVRTQVAVQKAFERRALARGEAGQGTLEFLGIAMIAVVLVGAIVWAVNQFNLASKVQEQLNQIGTPQGG